MLFEKLRSSIKMLSIKDLRGDFSYLNQQVNEKPIIYLDSANATLCPVNVIEAMNRYYCEEFETLDSSISNQNITLKINQLRKKLADFFVAESSENVIFTKNNSEAVNIILKGFPFVYEGNEIILLGDKESNDLLAPWLKLSSTTKIKREILFSREDNSFDLDNFIRYIRQTKVNPNKRISLLCISYVSSLDGSINPIEEICRIAHQNKVKVLLDISHASTTQSINLSKLKVDYAIVSANSMFGPMGISALIGSSEALEELKITNFGSNMLKDLKFSGDSETSPLPEKFELGPLNYPAIIGWNASLDYLNNLGVSGIKNYILKLNKALIQGIAGNDKIKILGPIAPEDRSGILSFVITGKNNKEVAEKLYSEFGIKVSVGKINSNAWFNKENVANHFKEGVIRISFNFYNSLEEIEAFIKAINQISS